MNTKPIKTCSVMFADVAGSTKLYEQMGDERANSIISEVIEIMCDAITTFSGTIIKTIGDEVMCRFSQPDDCAKAAIQIQESLELGMIQGAFVSVRIGFHTGKVLIQGDGDIFGDTVNTAARMAGIAKGRQVVLTKSSAEQLSSELQLKARDFDKVLVKGKEQPLSISELVWENTGVTKMVSIVGLLSQLKKEIVLSCNGKDFSAGMDEGEIQIGRSPESDFIVDTEFVSRMHAKIAVKRGNFVLIDQSTNGTYVRSQDGNTRYLRRDEAVLTDTGIICLGTKIERGDPNWLVNYSISGEL